MKLFCWPKEGIYDECMCNIPQVRDSRKTVLITGAAGFVGHHTLAHLLKTTDYKFVVTDSFKHLGVSARLRSVLSELPHSAQRMKIVTHDLTTPIDLVTFREFGKVEIIINMASESHVDRSITEPRTFISNNVDLVLTMLDYARQLESLEVYIQISTDEVYGPAKVGTTHSEANPHLPSNPYAASKAAQENICYSYWRTYGLPMIITNTMNIIGERQDKEKFVPMVIHNLLKNLPITIHAQKLSSEEWLSGSRYYLHARNQADAIRHLLENRSALSLNYNKNQENELQKFNVVGEKELFNDEVVDVIAKTLGLEARYSYVDFHSSRPGHDLRYALNGEKLKNFGWNPPIPLLESLERTVKWYVQNPDWLRSY